MDTTKPQAQAAVLAATLRLEGEPLSAFAAELKRLTPDEKRELAEAAAKHLGVTLIEAPAPQA